MKHDFEYAPGWGQGRLVCVRCRKVMDCNLGLVPTAWVVDDCFGPPKEKPELPARLDCSQEFYSFANLWDLLSDNRRTTNAIIAYLKARE